MTDRFELVSPTTTIGWRHGGYAFDRCGRGVAPGIGAWSRLPQLLVAAVVLVAVAGCHRQAPAAVDATPPLHRLDGLRITVGSPGERQRGVSWVAGPEPVTRADFAPLARTGVTWIVQTPFGWQRDERSPEVRLVTGEPVYWGERDAGLEATTRLARELGIRTILKPHVWLSRPTPGAWRGEIAMAGDAEWRAWFASYRRFLLHYAALAERLEIPVLVVGTELRSTVRERPEEWRELVRAVREVYSGRLTYAANWYREVEEVTFWDELDFIGVQGYYPLSQTPLPTVEELVAAWEPHVAALEALHRKHRKPVLFTEIGYVSRPGTTAEPWLWPQATADRELTETGVEAQARAYEAFFRVFWHRPWLAGVHFWKWYPGRRGEAVAGRVDFSPQGKPAEEVLRRWYTAHPPDGVRPAG